MVAPPPREDLGTSAIRLPPIVRPEAALDSQIGELASGENCAGGILSVTSFSSSFKHRAAAEAYASLGGGKKVVRNYTYLWPICC